jgi:hypothetical protein
LPAVRKTQLQYSQDTNFVLFGIVTPLPDYRTAWLVNQALGIRLVRQPDLQTTQSEQRTSFSCFKCEQPLIHSVYYLISNKWEGAVYDKTNKMTDYILLLQGAYYQESKQLIQHKLSEEAAFQAVLNLEASKQKHIAIYQL